MNTIYVSLGPNCHTAGILQELKYKNCSYPFDWVLSNLEIVTHNISNDFNDFINRDNFIYTTNNKITLKHTNINYLGNMFVHKNPIENIEDFNYYLRCVERFNKLKENNNRILLFYSSYNNECMSDTFITDVNKLLYVLNKSYTNFYLLIFNYVNVQNVKQQNTFNYTINDNLITINISIMYDNKPYAIDYAINNFFKIFNPIQEICVNLN
jgi:hypothetical protein